MPTIFTIGYEGSDVQRFVSVLLAVGIKMLVDVRAVPISRKRGFSKSALRDHLCEAGIGYCHLGALGNPKPGRIAASSGDFSRFVSIYKTHFRTANAQDAFRAILELASKESICLMCFERDAKTCHRDIITDEMEIRGFDCIDLLGDDPDRYVGHTGKLSRRYPRQSLAAAE